MKHSNKHDLVTVGGVTYTALKVTRTMPPGVDWIESVVSGAGLFPVPEVPDPIPGRDGEPGAAGERGADGESLNPRGEWRKGLQVKRLDCFRHNEATYAATVDGLTKSPPSKGWMLLCRDGETPEAPETIIYSGQRGRPGRDGRDAVLDTPAVCDSPASIGDVVYISGDGHVDLALANNVDTATAVGIVTGVNSSAITYRTTGVVMNPNWSLTPKAVYYLDPFTPGGMTTTYPETAGHFVVILGVATSPTQLALNIHYMVEQS